MTDLSTTYLGLPLSNPLVPSASPLGKSLDNLKRMEDSGAGAVVLHSLFEEQINAESHELDYFLSQGTESYAEALSYFPEASTYRLAPDEYLEHIRRAKRSLGIPVIGSLNGVSSGGWVKYARHIQEAGADALELNMYVITTDPGLSGGAVEDMYTHLLIDIRREVTIPVAVKLSPFFSALPNMVQRLVDAGADGLVLFNRFYQPDIDLETLEVVPRPGLSIPAAPQALRLPLRWIAILYGRIAADLALTGGVHGAEDVLKGLMAGAAVVMTTSELLARGIDRLAAIRADLVRWMEDHDYESVNQMRGSMSQRSCPHPAAFERAHYVRA
ncbi:MAG: dihydroorotate dehydrogenase-like protein, partial [Anaerolineales bacterium]|nr:dihydroorotate dehydrogenase-like protein [Anaerolineales bacterium]